MNKYSHLVKSYWHAYIAIEGAFLAQYALGLINGSVKFDWYSFGYAATGAVLAPATRAIVAKYPFLSPLAIRLTTKFAQANKSVIPLEVSKPSK